MVPLTHSLLPQSSTLVRSVVGIPQKAGHSLGSCSAEVSKMADDRTLRGQMSGKMSSFTFSMPSEMMYFLPNHSDSTYGNPRPFHSI